MLLREAETADERLTQTLEDPSGVNVDRRLNLLETIVKDLDNIRNVIEAKNPDLASTITESILKYRANIKSVEKMVSFASRYMNVPSATPPQASHEIEMKVQWKPIPFSGDLRSWLQFWDLFKTAVHLNPKYSDSVKLKCLTDCLRGEAAQVLGSLSMIGSNYKAAVDALFGRYNNTASLQTIYLMELEEMPVATKGNMRRILDSISNIETSITTLKGVQVDDTHLKRLILRKFPEDILKTAIRAAEKLSKEEDKTKGDFEFSTKQLIKALDREVALVEYLSLNRDEASRERVTTVAVTANSVALKRAAGVPENSKTTCVFCDKPHKSELCRGYPTNTSRRNRISELNRCFICLGQSHVARECRSGPAVCKNCQGKHNVVFCGTPKKERQPTPSTSPGKCQHVFLQTFTCILINNNDAANENNHLTVRGLLDTGSRSSFIADEVVRELKLPLGRRVQLKCFRFMESKPKLIESFEVTVTLENNLGSRRSFKLFTTEQIIGASHEQTNLEAKKILPKRIPYADKGLFSKNPLKISLLIGLDYYYDVVNPRLTRSLSEGGMLLSTFFGWMPAGNIGGEAPQDLESTISLAVEAESADEEANLNRLWDLEILGIENPKGQITTELVLREFRKTTYIDQDGRYVVRFPWKDNRTRLPTNFKMALARLTALLRSTPLETLGKGDEHFKELQEAGIIEIASPQPNLLVNVGSDELKRVHYLPHRWLMQKNKIRVVYDASAKTKTGHSLNDLIYPGPNLTECLVGLLMNFRLGQVGLSADIEKAFLQIRLNELDRDVTRFLWVKDFKQPALRENLVYYRFARVPFGINASPFLLNMVLQDLLGKSENKSVVHWAQHKFYVDNLIASVQTPTEAMNIYKVVTTKLGEIKMNLRDWVSNDAQFMRALPPSIRWKPKGEEHNLSILGMQWNVTHDILKCKINERLPTVGTKQNILRFLASIYDPMGLFSPCILELKILLRECWKNKYQWHQSLPESMQSQWIKARNEILPLKEISLPRQDWPVTEKGDYNLHIFCDASVKAYACCAYLTYENKTTLQMATILIYAKTRLAPKNLHNSCDELTIPKMELMATLIGKRCKAFLITHLDVKIQSTTLWVDATTVLHWLNSKELRQPFVQNRLNEIREDMHLTIRYVPTEDNPADFASRGKTPLALQNLNLWWKGPPWLNYKNLWPQPPLNVESYDPHNFALRDTEYMNKEINTLALAVSVLAIDAKASTPLMTTKIEKNFSSWNARVRVLRHVIKFCHLKANLPWQGTDMESFKLAERLLVIELQYKYFNKELNILKNKGKPLSNLDLFLDKGVIRCRGRLAFAKFPWETTHPALLPRESPATRDYIRMLHVTNGHIGATHTLAKLRERFWVIKGRALVKSVIHGCIICRRWGGGSYALPAIPPLPEIRLSTVAPFLYVGIDYFGPLRCVSETDKIMDVQVLLFTCLTTRAVHLELVPDLSGNNCYLALLRFAALRRVPQMIVSDNASTFKFIQPLVGIKVQLRDHKINAYVTKNRIAWYFIPQYAPWFGGAYERLNALVKNSLKRSYGLQLLNYEELRTALTVISDITNSRPLTYVSSEEPEQAITPNHFIKLGPTNINVDLGEPTPKPPISMTGAQLLEITRGISRILDAYWEAFRNLYILSLRERHTVQHPRKKGTAPFAPKVGDIVLVHEQSAPRAAWSLGKIEQLDKRQALATVRSKGQKILRSVRHLYPLEVACERPPTPKDTIQQENPPGPSTSSE